MHDGRGAGHLAKVWVFEGARAPFGEGGPRRAPPVGRAGGWELEKRMRIEFELRMVCLRRRRCQKAIQKAVRKQSRRRSEETAGNISTFFANRTKIRTFTFLVQKATRRTESNGSEEEKIDPEARQKKFRNLHNFPFRRTPEHCSRRHPRTGLDGRQKRETRTFRSCSETAQNQCRRRQEAPYLIAAERLQKRAQKTSTGHSRGHSENNQNTGQKLAATLSDDGQRQIRKATETASESRPYSSRGT